MPLPPKNIEVLSTEASAYLAKRLAKQLGVNHRHTIRRLFSNNEHYYRIDLTKRNELMGKDVIFVGSTHTDADLLELYRVGYALAQAGTRRRLFIIPFFGYATMERAVEPGEIVTAKTNARLLSAIPSPGLGNTFMLLDLHAPGLPYYFEGECTCVELSAEDILATAIKKLRLKNFVLASADLGMSVGVQKLAQRFDVEIVLISKARSFETTTVVAAIGNVQDKAVVIYDDMIRSGGSLIHAAEAYMQRGATDVYAVTSHLALNGPDIVTTLERSPLKHIISTNSHPMSQYPSVRASKKITIEDVSTIFSTAITQL